MKFCLSLREETELQRREVVGMDQVRVYLCKEGCHSLTDTAVYEGSVEYRPSTLERNKNSLQDLLGNFTGKGHFVGKAWMV
jgi:hypothetical protein